MNGICFLKTPDNLRTATGRDLFGPWEGHLVGCEYDTRRLVRMSLERVGETYQGAAYPLSVEPAEGEETFEGPVTCQVGPDGVSMSATCAIAAGAPGQNTGSIVRLRMNGSPPPGIAEVRGSRRIYNRLYAAGRPCRGQGRELHGRIVPTDYHVGLRRTGR